MSYSLNSRKGLIQGTAIGVTTEDTRSLDYGSHAQAASPLMLRQRARLTSTRTIANGLAGGDPEPFLSLNLKPKTLNPKS